MTRASAPWMTRPLVYDMPQGYDESRARTNPVGSSRPATRPATFVLGGAAAGGHGMVMACSVTGLCRV